MEGNGGTGDVMLRHHLYSSCLFAHPCYACYAFHLCHFESCQCENWCVCVFRANGEFQCTIGKTAILEYRYTVLRRVMLAQIDFEAYHCHYGI